MTKCHEKDYQVLNLHIIFVDDPYLLEINQVNLKHDFFTDIITFDYSQKTHCIEGEIYISLDRVKDNAKTYQSTYIHELHRVIFHGVLHLLGYKDSTEKEKTLMTEYENLWLHQYLS